MSTSTSVGSRDAAPLPNKFRFDPNDSFYNAPPMCSLLHYRDGAIFAGVVEVLLLLAGVFAFANLHSDRGLTELWTLLIMIALLVIGALTTITMFVGIYLESPRLLLPQISFLHLEVFLLLFGSVGSISSMSLGIEATHRIFSPFVSVPEMETHFGPIWPFNVAIVCFTSAALGIWFHLTIKGCQDYLLDKAYFEAQASNSPSPLELGSLRIDQSRQVD